MTINDILSLDRDELLYGGFLDEAYETSDHITRQRMVQAGADRAKAVGCEAEYKKIVGGYEKEIKKLESENRRNRNPVFMFETSDGKPLPTIANFLMVLRGDNKFSGLKFNVLSHRPEIEEDGKTRIWTDADDADTREYIERVYKFHSAAKCDDALRIVFREREYNPAKDLIDSIQWDYNLRIETFLIKWMKCEDTQYTREVSRLIFSGGIHRLYNPGCKFDDVPVLIGTRQGEGKSTFVRWLAMRDDFFTEVTEIEGQKGMEAIEGAWICEMGELLALNRAKDVEAVKSFITRQVDHYRRPYDKRTSDYKRSCVFIGTTNKEQFLTDKTGNRRFYPVTVNQTGYDLFEHEEEIKADIRQCWAEAKAYYDDGLLEPFANRSIITEIRENQQRAVEDDSRVGLIEKFLDGKNETCVAQLYKEALNMQNQISRRDSLEIGIIMDNMDGWKRCGRMVFDDYGRQRGWVRDGWTNPEIL